MSTTPSLPIRPALALAAALAAALLALALEALPAFTHLDYLARDAFFAARARLAPQASQAPISLIEMDDATFMDPDFRKPHIFWYTDYAEVILGLAEAGATVVALDHMLPDVLFDDFIPGYSQRWVKTLGLAARAGTPVVLGYQDYPDSALLPNPRYLSALRAAQSVLPGPRREKEQQPWLGYFNLSADKDNFVRRYTLSLPGAKPGGSPLSFALAVALAGNPDLVPPAEPLVVDYPTREPAFPRHSLADVARRLRDGDKAWLAEQFRGRTVFIGSTDSRNQDAHPTPLYYTTGERSLKTPGVLIHAAALDTLLSGRTTAEPGRAARLALYLACTLAVALAGMFCPERLVFLPAPATLALLLGAGLWAYLGRTILPVAQGAVAVILSGFGTFLARDFIVNKEKRRLRNLFQRYLPPAVVEQMVTGHDSDFFAGQNKKLCILFSDVRSFTTYSETRTPAEIVARLNAYFHAMAEEIGAEGGIVDKFIGDGILAFFGAVRPTENVSLDGVRAAIRMQERLKTLNEGWAARGEQPFKIGVGLHTGVVMVGNIGSEHKTEFTVIGDAVNLASRLESKTKELATPILVSEVVAGDVREFMDVEEKGVVPIKGRKEENVFGVLGPRRNT